MKNLIYAVNGPVIKVRDTEAFSMLEKVYVGPKKLMGEVISISKKETIIQVYESTSGLKKGDEVIGTKTLVSLVLGPGILNNIFDGIQRPLKTISQKEGIFIAPGSQVAPLDEERLWHVQMLAKEGDVVSPGQIIALVPETSAITNKVMIPSNLSGEIIECRADGKYTIKTNIAKVKDAEGNIHPINLVQEWPIKIPRPTQEHLLLDIPLITGQRVIDTLFPLAKGGAAVIPGGFGAGKTMMQHQLAKWCDADIIVYVGCGERGNEMTQVLEEFQSLIDPHTHKSLMERTVLIANTSNMPVAAREASIYTGITIAEYYRDMGYNVAMMADSTSRWAEALREISGRLEEMPAEEGFPAYLPSRIAQFYERAGMVINQNGTRGSVSIIGAVSPQGADFSEPVTQNTKRFVRCFWALDKNLAYQRHYPSVNWHLSYSEYLNDLTPWYNKHYGPRFMKDRTRIRTLLAQEDKLMEIVRLIGNDVLPDDQKLVLEIGRVIRQGFLQQSAFHEEDTYVPLRKQQAMIEAILLLYDETDKAISQGKPLSLVLKTGLFEEVTKMKYQIKNDEIKSFDRLKERIVSAISKVE
ncbi:MAG TPA: V-type ATP synthase subunit A [Bacilli bacterium]|nr:V-type ATP synthase subunit A [Bacilli bacterium]HPS18762.1 V-type ATP synthase subunit A [Bacilli bacterium]